MTSLDITITDFYVNGIFTTVNTNIHYSVFKVFTVYNSRATENFNMVSIVILVQMIILNFQVFNCLPV